MKKTNVTISLDQDCYDLAKGTIGNLSGFFNDVLKDTLEEDNPEAKKVFEMREYLKNLEKKAKEKETELNSLSDRLNGLIEKKESVLCRFCEGNFWKNVKGKPICRACFLDGKLG